MNKKIATLIVGVLLISIVSAGLLDYFGKIEGSVTVEGPVFYAMSGAEPDGTPGYLSINNPEGSESSFTITGGSTRYFKTEELDEMEFYAPKLNLSAEAYLVDGTNSNLLDLTFGYYDTFTGGTEHPFCNVTINVTSDNAEIYFGICNGGPANSLEAFYYSIHNMGTNDVKIKVTTHYQNTMVKVLGVAN